MKIKITKVNCHKIYRKNQTKMLKKIFGINKHCCSKSRECDKKDGKGSPSYGHDIYNNLTRYGMTSSQIQTIMKLDGRLGF